MKAGDRGQGTLAFSLTPPPPHPPHPTGGRGHLWWEWGVLKSEDF